jgi:hypothetical protein
MAGALPAIYAGSLWLKHGRVVGHYSGYEDWLEVREHVECHGVVILWRYGQTCGNFTPAGVCVAGDYFNMRQP